MIRVFVSYSHDSDSHRARVLGLSERLRADGIETILDQYVERGSPPEGWPRWMLNGLATATHVLCVCTETYYRRFLGLEGPGRGRGVDWEGARITQALYDDRRRSNRFLAVVFDPADEDYIPEPLRGPTHYVLDSEAGYQVLYDDLLNQGGFEPGPIGELKRKPRASGRPGTYESPPPTSEPEAVSSPALTVWRQKLEFLLVEEAIASDAEQKFGLAQRIKKARAKIAELEAEGRSQDSDSRTERLPHRCPAEGGGGTKPSAIPQAEPPDDGALTFKQYFRQFKEIWGWLAGALAISGPIFGVFQKVTPPAAGAGLLTIVTFFSALLIPYLLIRGLRISSRGLAGLATGAVVGGLAILVYYLAVVYETYVHERHVSGERARTIRCFKGTETGYRPEFVKEVLPARHREGMGTNLVDVVRDITCDQMESVFSPSALSQARLRVLGWFSAACLLIELGLCSLAALEGLRTLRRPVGSSANPSGSP